MNEDATQGSLRPGIAPEDAEQRRQYAEEVLREKRRGWISDFLLLVGAVGVSVSLGLGVDWWVGTGAGGGLVLIYGWLLGSGGVSS
jgi:hypothetical protein